MKPMGGVSADTLSDRLGAGPGSIVRYHSAADLSAIQQHQYQAHLDAAYGSETNASAIQSATDRQSYLQGNPFQNAAHLLGGLGGLQNAASVVQQKRNGAGETLSQWQNRIAKRVADGDKPSEVETTIFELECEEWLALDKEMA